MNSRHQFVITRKRQNQRKAKERKRLACQFNELDEELRWLAGIRLARSELKQRRPVATPKTPFVMPNKHREKFIESRLNHQREVREELRYRFEERLSILTQGAPASPEQIAQAEQEANQWLDFLPNQ